MGYRPAKPSRQRLYRFICRKRNLRHHLICFRKSLAEVHHILNPDTGCRKK